MPSESPSRVSNRPHSSSSGCQSAHFRETRGLGARFGREIGAGQRDVVDPARLDFDLTVTYVSQQKGESVQLQRSAVEGMTRIGNCDLTLGKLRV
jgi:hypothetical protein